MTHTIPTSLKPTWAKAKFSSILGLKLAWPQKSKSSSITLTCRCHVFTSSDWLKTNKRYLHWAKKSKDKKRCVSWKNADNIHWVRKENVRPVTSTTKFAYQVAVYVNTYGLSYSGFFPGDPLVWSAWQKKTFNPKGPRKFSNKKLS